MWPTRIAECIFWACALWCAYVYLLYPLLLSAACALVQVRRDWNYFSARRNRRERDLDTASLPPVSMVVPCHNEARFLAAKLTNLRELDYPGDRLDIIFISDGSTDGTNSMLERTGEGFRTVIQTSCQGKAQALNRGVELARHDLLILCDAATLLAPDAVRKLVRHFARPGVGVVCGALQFQASDESQRTEGLYWRYESLIRLMESRLGATLTASGALYALRKRCYRPLEANVLLDDFEIPMNAREQGYTVEYDPEANALDFAASSIEDEFTRRVRLAVGSFRALGRLLRVRLNACTRWAFLSHKVGRWLLPFVLIPLFATSLVLVGHPFFRFALTLQAAFYLWALVGLSQRHRAWRIRTAGFAYYLLAMNAAFVVGLLLLIFRQGQTKWQRAQ